MQRGTRARARRSTPSSATTSTRSWSCRSQAGTNMPSRPRLRRRGLQAHHRQPRREQGERAWRRSSPPCRRHAAPSTTLPIPRRCHPVARRSRRRGRRAPAGMSLQKGGREALRYRASPRSRRHRRLPRGPAGISALYPEAMQALEVGRKLRPKRWCTGTTRSSRSWSGSEPAAGRAFRSTQSRRAARHQGPQPRAAAKPCRRISRAAP
jgi:hypothetical protein